MKQQINNYAHMEIRDEKKTASMTTAQKRATKMPSHVGECLVSTPPQCPSPYYLPCPTDVVKNMTIGPSPSLVTQSFFVCFLLFHTEEKRIQWKTFLYCGDSHKRISLRYHS